MTLTLKKLDECFTIHRLPKLSEIPSQVFSAPIYFIANTDDEVSIVLPQDVVIESNKSEKNWQAFKVAGPLDFALTGVLSKIATVLAEKEVSIFAISTFDTDYILVKKDVCDAAINALKANKYHIS